jgi:hypothetical protein
MKEATVEKAYDVRQEANRTVFAVQRRAPSRMAGGTLLFMLAFIVALGGSVGSCMVLTDPFMRSKETPLILIVTLVAWLGVYFVPRWMRKPSVVSLLIDDRGIAVNDTLYRFGEIARIGYEDTRQVQVTGDAVTVGAQMMAGAYPFQIYVIYGTRKVPILVGLSDAELIPVYKELLRVCSKHGYAAP